MFDAGLSARGRLAVNDADPEGPKLPSRKSLALRLIVQILGQISYSIYFATKGDAPLTARQILEN